MNSSKSICATFVMALMLLAGCSGNHDTTPAAATVVWVSPAGKDTAKGTASDPLATLEAARDRVRALGAAERKGPVVIQIKGGTYRLDQPFALQAQDSGTAEAPVIYRAAPNERPLIVGSKPITGWVKDESRPGVYKATGVHGKTRQLYVNGVRAVRAKTKDYPPGFRPAFYYQNGVAYPEGIQYVPPTTAELKNRWPDPTTWTNVQHIEAVMITQWKMVSVPLEAVVPYPQHAPAHKPFEPTKLFPAYPVPDRTGLIRVSPEPWKNANLFIDVQTKQPSMWSFWQVTHFENAKEFLDEPGEWYLDPQGTLYYYPRPGEDMATAQVEMPVLEALVIAQGTPTAPVSHIRFEGLSFAYSTWLSPAQNGYVSDQSGFHITGPKPYYVDALGHQKDFAVRTPGSLRFSHAQNVVFDRTTFMHLGSAGLDLIRGIHNTVVSNSLFTDISSAAIQLGGIEPQDQRPPSPADAVQNNQIINNVVYKVGQEYVDSAGIFVGFSSGTLIKNNTISDINWSGIAMGWGWGLLDPGMFPGLDHAKRGEWGVYTQPTQNSGNRISNNVIQRFLMKLIDGGAIYTTGHQGTSMNDALLIEGNVAKDKRPDAGGNVFYTDGGSRYVKFKSNAAFNNPQGVVFFGDAAHKDDPLPYPAYSNFNGIEYGKDIGGCRAYGDVVYEANYFTRFDYYSPCPYSEGGEKFPVGMDFIHNKAIVDSSAVPPSLLNAAGVKNFPQALLDAAGVKLP